MARPNETNVDTETGRSHADHGHDDHAVRELLERLASALSAGDAHAVSEMWEPPAIVIGDEAVQPVSSVEEVERFFAGARDQYTNLGITETRAAIERIEWATDRIVIVDVRWPYLDEDGAEQGHESSTYTLRLDDDGELKIRVVILRSAAPTEH
jgi:ketosteroid isomerase-like protein